VLTPHAPLPHAAQLIAGDFRVLEEGGQLTLPQGVVARVGCSGLDREQMQRDMCALVRQMPKRESLMKDMGGWKCLREFVQRRRDRRLITLYFEGVLVGFLFVKISEMKIGFRATTFLQHWYVDLYAVRMDLSGRGFGKYLLDRMLRLLDHADVVVAAIHHWNKPSLKCFRKVAGRRGRHERLMGVMRCYDKEGRMRVARSQEPEGKDDLAMWGYKKTPW
jgi:L-amino acid N-acyltransferase YncA